MSYSSTVLADSPLAYWRLGETSGTSATDSSGNSRSATYTNSPTLGSTGLLTGDADKAMGVTANAGTCTTIASASWMNVSTITVECLVKLTSAADSTNGDALVSRYTSAGFQWLLWRDTSGKFAVQFSESNGSTRSVVSTVTAVSGTTYHLAFTYTGSVLTLYVNGVASGTPFTGMSGVFPSTAPIEAGRYSGASGTTPGGTIDEVAIYGTALSSTRIAAHYTAATTAPSDASGTASLSLSASGGAAATGAGSATLSLSASGGTSAAAAGSASLSLSASGALVPPVPASGSAALSLSASGGASGSPAGSASLNLTATGAAFAVLAASGSATLTLTASGSAVMSAAGSATLTLSAGGIALALFTTDTSNALDGLDLLLTMAVFLPVAVAAPPASLAEKYDKALAYPTPTMAGGRPT